ncbi:hypothetical protein Nhal_3778 [Nitrosococcus halophilus Nc 4]|uniref:PEP-CTERM protein-sorting domain-containing protein n=1 Tax=Nitrosococcus halophilus (strain Nc4) TaxID=472759 RepID=D5C2W9_NITHN|nr:DUF4114 domain-containing protein [Nitrosococcus halophilus]ADE16794.1 hypothetical protein Nhal_3778 [Nitrosococcus halophilus Nc 4]
MSFVKWDSLFVPVLISIWLLFIPSVSLSTPIQGNLGEPVLGGGMWVVEDGEVTAEYVSKNARYSHHLYLIRPTGEDLLIFDSTVDAIGSTVSLGRFDSSTELIFRLFAFYTAPNLIVRDNFFSGPAERNRDGVAHALAVTIFDELSSQYITEVAFEDLYGGGDQDYNDFVFQLTNIRDPLPPAAVSEPSSLALIGMGIACLSFVGWRAV